MKWKLLLVMMVWVLMGLRGTSAAAQPMPIRIGLNTQEPPFAYQDATGGSPTVRGLDVDVARLLGKILNRKVEFYHNIQPSSRQDMLAKGRVDMLITATPGMMPEGTFVLVPTGISQNRRLFVKSDCRDVVCLKDLGTKHVVMLAGDNPWHESDYPVPQELTVVSDSLKALQLLENGQADVFVAPSEEVAHALILKYGLRNIRKVGVILEKHPLYIILRQEDQAFLSDVVTAMEKLRTSGALTKIREKWFGVDFAPPPWQKYKIQIFSVATFICLGIFGVVIWNRQLKIKVMEVTRGLQASERNFRSVIDSSPDMIVVVDRAGHIHQWNPSAKRLLIGEAGIVPQTLTQNFIIEERRQWDTFLNQVFDTGRGALHFHLKVDQGGEQEIDVVATLVSDQETGAPLACCFARDMTERIRMEQELIQADRLATIGKMAAGVAHEINNPLGIIQANVELLLTHGLDPETRCESLEAIRRNTIRAGNITRDLLAVARPRTPQMAELDLYGLVRTILSMVAPQLKGITVVHQQPPSPLTVWGDGCLLQQVFLNVVLNAKTALEGRPTPRLWVRYCQPRDGSVRVLVVDNGRGISREHLTVVFDPFFTIGNPEGFGLGLFISQRIVENHGGVMYAESELGKGTKIIIELPMPPDQTSTIPKPCKFSTL